METAALIRVGVLCDLLEATLSELDDERFYSSQLVEQLRELSERASEALDQLRPSGAE